MIQRGVAALLLAQGASAAVVADVHAANKGTNTGYTASFLLIPPCELNHDYPSTSSVYDWRCPP